MTVSNHQRSSVLVPLECECACPSGASAISTEISSPTNQVLLLATCRMLADGASLYRTRALSPSALHTAATADRGLQTAVRSACLSSLLSELSVLCQLLECIVLVSLVSCP
jgi:hypothetical protein